MSRARAIAGLATIVLCGSVAACAVPQRADAPYVSVDDHYRTQTLADWTPGLLPGATIFRDPLHPAASVVIRAIPRDQLQPRPADDVAIVAATETLIEALPNVRIDETTRLTGRGRRGAAQFSFTFTPDGQGPVVERRHAVIVTDDRVFHVICTSPVSDDGEAQSQFAVIIDSLEEV